MSTFEEKSSLTAIDHLAKGRLSVSDTVAQSLGFVAPVMGVAFLTNLVAMGAGAASPLAMLLGGIGVLFIGLTVAQFAHKYPHAGSMYEYVSQTAGPFPGFMAGWIYMIGALFLSVAIFPGLGGFIQGLFAAHNITVPWIWFSLGFVVVSLLLQYIDIRFATRVQLVIVFLASAIIFVFAIYVIIKGGAQGNGWWPFNPKSAANGWSGIGKGLVFAFLMFSGFEASAVLSEETKDAKRTIAVTVLAAVGIILVYFVVVVYAEALSYGKDAANTKWPEDFTPLFTMGAQYGGSWLVDVLSVAAIVDAIAVTVAVAVTTTRMLYALGRDGIMPRAFGKTHPKHKTPHIAIFTVSALSIVYILVSYFIGWDALTSFGFGGGTGSLALILIYLIISIAAFTLDWRGVWIARVIIPIIAIGLTAYAIYSSVYPVPPAPNRWMPYVMLALIVVGVIVGLVARSRKVPAMLSVEGQVQADVA